MKTVINKFHGTTAHTTLTKEDYEMAGYRDGGMMCEQPASQISINRRAKALDKKLCPHASQCKCAGMYVWET